MIDAEGYRENVGIIVVNDHNHVLWAKRIGYPAWQFPQGGINDSETAEQAMFRELHEEIGLSPEDVKLLGCTRDWLYYELPNRMVRHHTSTLVIGQKQKWFMLRLVADEQKVMLDLSPSPEFDSWCWADYWHPVESVIYFKQSVYQQALEELQPLIF